MIIIIIVIANSKSTNAQMNFPVSNISSAMEEKYKKDSKECVCVSGNNPLEFAF